MTRWSPSLRRTVAWRAAVNGDDISTWDGGQAASSPKPSTPSVAFDILVNNAGILRDKMSFNMDESDWDDVIRVHLKGHFAPTHHAAVYWRNLAKQGEAVTGRIINTSSEAGLFGNAGQANYSAAKAGIAALTWILARELGRYGVTANAIAPRARTRMTEALFGELLSLLADGALRRAGILEERGQPGRLLGRTRSGRHHRARSSWSSAAASTPCARSSPSARSPGTLPGRSKELIIDAKGDLFKPASTQASPSFSF